MEEIPVRQVNLLGGQLEDIRYNIIIIYMEDNYDDINCKILIENQENVNQTNAHNKIKTNENLIV